MPKITAKLDHLPLFDDDDPLVVDVFGFGEWRLSDYEVNPPYEDEISPERSPLVYMVEYLCSMVREDPDGPKGATPLADALREKLVDALEANRLGIVALGELIGDISEAYAEAAKRRLGREAGRPTRRRRR